MIGLAAPAYDPAAPTTANTLPVGAPATVRPTSASCTSGTAARSCCSSA